MDYRSLRAVIIEGVIAGELPSRLIQDHEIEELSARVDAAVFDCVHDEAFATNPTMTFATDSTVH